jgi:hypothetical protein
MSSNRRRWRRELTEITPDLRKFRRRGQQGSDAAALQEVWAQIVGPQAAAQSIVIRRSRAGVVNIACSSAAWAQELDSRRERWTEQLREQADVVVTGVRFVVGDHVMPAPPVGASAEPITPTAAELAQAEAGTPQIADRALRDLLIRAQAGQMALARERKRLQKAEKARPSSRPR